jgi:hypothetical protein
MRLPQSSALAFRLLSASFIILFSSLLAFAGSRNGQQLRSSPANLSFGAVEVSQSLSQAVTLTNSGKTSATVSAVSVSNPAFQVSGLAFPMVLAAGQSTTATITFAPGSAGWNTGSVTVTSTAANTTLSIGVAGNAVASDPLTASPSSLSFGNVAVGSKSTLPVIITNSQYGKVILTSYQTSGTGFTVSGPTLPLTLSKGQSATLNTTFAPTASGSASGSVFLAGPGLTVSFSGTGSGSTTGQLSASPSSLGFGSVTVGSNESLSGTITNTGSSSVSVSNVQISGTGFTLSGISSSFTLNAGQSTTFTVKFAPTSTGAASGSVTVTSNASNPTLTTSLSANGTTTAGQLTVSPSSIGFGNVDVGSSAAQTSTISATGGTVTVNSAASSSSQYVISGAAFPLTLNSGQSAQITVSFAPTTAGASSATLTYTTSTSAKSTESTSGTGVAPQYTVNLSWNASTSSVSGYNVYRGTTSGVYTKINSAVDPATSYSDNTVAAGTTYYYAATSVSSSGQESTYSAPIQVSVP